MGSGHGQVATDADAVGRDMLRFATSQVGVPWVHAARAPGQGLDCAGLIVCSARSAGMEPKDDATYPEFPPPGLLGRMLRANGMRPVELSDKRPGDVLTFWIRRRHEEVHAGVDEANGSMIHARREIGGGRVRREALGRFWTERLMARWRYV